MLLMGIVQFGLAFHNYLSITDATRVGATGSRGQADRRRLRRRATAIQNTVSAKQWSTISGRITCTAGVNTGDQVKLTVKYPYNIGLPGFSASGDLTASATERLE